MPTVEEVAGLELVGEGLEKLNEGMKALSAVPGDGGDDDPFADLANSSALDSLEIGKGIMTDEQLAAVLEEIEKAKGASDQTDKVVKILVKIGKAAVKAMA